MENRALDKTEKSEELMWSGVALMSVGEHIGEIVSVPGNEAVSLGQRGERWGYHTSAYHCQSDHLIKPSWISSYSTYGLVSTIGYFSIPICRFSARFNELLGDTISSWVGV